MIRGGKYIIPETLVPVEPCCTKKLILGSAAYARNLGFKPQEDYEVARFFVLEGIDVAACKTEYEFGREGKSFYISGPHETPKKVDRIIKQLRKRCGDGGFEFMAKADQLR